ncbi:MAG: cobalamin B12-binding domain-containing protein, partial [FCB group bacterium]|nr:cobalamin B12-binding domain-containing protein [FCB group bacterium]
MKIHLINPPSPGDYPFIREGRCMQKEGVWTTVWPPISLATIGAVLREHGFDVKINDCPSERIRIGGLKEILRDYRPDLLIINTATPSILHDLTIPHIAKETLPGIKTAVFGIHVGTLPEDSFETAGGAFDYFYHTETECIGLVRSHTPQ